MSKKADLLTLVVTLKTEMESLNYNLINSGKLRKMVERLMS